MPPRKKTAPGPAAKARADDQPTAAQEASVALAATEALAKEVVELGSSLSSHTQAWRADSTSSGLIISEHRKATDKLLAEAAGRIVELERAMGEIQQRNQDHAIAGATRRAAASSRLAAVEGAVKVLERAGTDSGLVGEEQLSQALRNLWLALAGVGVAVAVIGVKAFAG